MGDAIYNGVASTTAEVTSALTDNLPLVFAVFGGLIALGIVIRLVKKLVGRKA